jgi:hypothetical protein
MVPAAATSGAELTAKAVADQLAARAITQGCVAMSR